jgi:uncharacterized protein YoxC
MASQREERLIEIIVNGQKADANLKQMEASVRVLGSQLKSLTPGTEEFIQKTKQLQEVNARIQSVRNDIKGVDTALKDSQSSAFSFKAAFVGALAAISFKELAQMVINFGVEAVKLAAKYSDAFADIRKSTGMTTQEVADLNKTLSKVDTRTSQEALLDIVKVGGQLGIAKKEIEGFTVAVDRAVVALGDEFAGGAEEVAKEVGGLSKLFKDVKDLDAGTAINNIGSAINDLGAAGSANGPFMTDFAKRIGGLGNLAPEVSQTLGLGAALQELGETAENAASGTKEILLAATKDIPAFASQMKLTNQELKTLINSNPNEVILKLADSFKGASNTSIVNTLNDLNIKSIQGSGVMMKLATSVDFVKEKQLLASNAMKEGTSLTKEFNIKNETLAAVMEKNAKKVEAFKLAVGEGLAPAFFLIMKVLEQLGGFFKTSFEGLMPYFTMLGNAIGKLASSLGFAGDAGSIFSYIMGKIGTAVEFAFSIIKVGITIISGLIYVFKALYDFFPPFRIAINAVVGAVKMLYDILVFTVEGINSVIKGLEKFFSMSGKEVKVKQTVESNINNKTTNSSQGSSAQPATDPAAEEKRKQAEAELQRAIEEQRKKEEARDAEQQRKEEDSAQKKRDKAAKDAEREKQAQEKKAQDIEKMQEDFRQKSLAADQALETLKLANSDQANADKFAKLKAAHDKELAAVEKLENSIRENEAISEEQKNALLAKYLDQRALMAEDYRQKEAGLQKKSDEEYREAKNTRDLAEKELAIITAEEGSQAELDAKLAKLELEKEIELENKLLTEEEKALIEAQYAQQSDDLYSELAEKKKAKEREIKDAAINVGRQILGAISDFSKISTDKKIAEAEKVKNEEIKKLDEQLKSGAITRDQYDAAKQAAEDKYNAKAKEEKRKQAKLDKEIALVNAIIATALAVVKALPSIPLSILAGISGAIGIATIAATPLPQFAKGGRTVGSFSGGGPVNEPYLAMAGEAGAEWIAPNWMVEHPKYANVIGWLESQRVRKFAEGGTTLPVQVPSSASTGGDPTAVMLQLLSAILDEHRSFRQEVSTWQRELQVHNDVGATQQGIQMLNKLRSDASVG